jgi:O-antigen/teichoic acid export membrane protein
MQRTDSIKSSFSRSSVFVFMGKLVRFSLLYGTQILLINLLLPADFGLMRYVTLLVGVASLINEMGLTTALVQKKEIRDEEIGGSFVASVIWGIFLYIIIFFCAPLAALFFKSPQLTSMLRVGSLIIPIASAGAVPRACFQRRMRFGILATIEAVAAVFASSIMVGLALKGFGAWSLVAGSLVQEFLSLTALLSLVKIPEINLKALLHSKKIFYVGVELVVLRIIDYCMYCVPFFVIGKLFGQKALGVFSVAYDLSLLPHLMINAVMGNVAISAFSRLQDDRSRTVNGFSQLMLLSSTLVIPIFLSMSLLSNEIIHVVCFFKHNDSWLEASSLIRWLSLTGVVYMITAFPFTIWYANKKLVQAIIWNSAMLATTIIAVIAGLHWGITGVAFAMFIRSVLLTPIFIYVNYRVTGITVRVYLKSFMPSLTCGLIMIAPVIAAQNLIAGTTLSRHITVMLVSVVCGGITYLLAINILFRSSLVPFKDLFRKRNVLFVKTILP